MRRCRRSSAKRSTERIHGSVGGWTEVDGDLAYHYSRTRFQQNVFGVCQTRTLVASPIEAPHCMKCVCCVNGWCGSERRLQQRGRRCWANRRATHGHNSDGAQGVRESQVTGTCGTCTPSVRALSADPIVITPNKHFLVALVATATVRGGRGFVPKAAGWCDYTGAAGR